MVTEAVKPGPRKARNGTKNGYKGDSSSGHWPRNIVEAYARYRGPYTLQNASTLLEEEPLELYNGWLVWQKMTDSEERRVAANIQEILSLAARLAGWGQAYPDQFECAMKSGDLFKPDVCVLSHKRFETQVEPSKPDGGHLVLKGGAEIIIENRSPSNTRKEERDKRAQYFDNGTLVVWDVEPKRRKIWVYEAENPTKGREYKVGDIIDCPQLLPGWQRPVADFFAKELSAEQIAGQAAVQWRAEAELEALRKVILRQTQRRFGIENLPAGNATRLSSYNLDQLNELADKIVTSASLEEWLASFPN